MKIISKCENHDQALRIWRENEIMDGIVIHVDAHIDFTAPDECFYITIANYLNYAYVEDIIKSLIWIIPDESFRNNRIIEYIINEIYSFFRLVEKNENELVFELINNEKFIMHITTINYVDKLKILECEDNILLDIDCDYFMNPRISQTYSYCFPEKTWIKSQKFCEKIDKIYERSSITTISNSIIGGYTPLLFSFLSKQIEELFQSKVNTYIQMEKAIEIMSLCPNQAYKEFLKIPQSFSEQIEMHRLLAITYCNMLNGNYVEARKDYPKLFDTKKNYERYFLPVHGMIKEGLYLPADILVDKWLNVAPYSQVAICYKIRVALEDKRINSRLIETLFDLISDEKTDYEKSYLYILYCIECERYSQAINVGLNVLNFLSVNDTPDWADQISSFEKYKNHGIIIAKVYNFISIAYMKLGKKNEAIKYARICKLMGFPAELA